MSDGDQAALYRGARLGLFPSLNQDRPDSVRGGSLRDGERLHAPGLDAGAPSVLGSASVVDLDVAGPFVLSLVESDARRQRIVAEIRAIAQELTWERTGAGYIDVYARALARGPRPMSRLLLGVTPAGGTPGLTEREAFLIAVYRRSGVRAAADGVLGVGSLVPRAARRVLAR